MTGQQGSAGTGPPPDPREQLVADLSEMLRQLTDLLRPVDEDIKVMDANAQSAHGIARDIDNLIRTRLFGQDGFLDRKKYQQPWSVFDDSSAMESDEYEVYKDDLEYIGRLSNQAPRLRDRDDDRRTLIRARRIYVQKLREFRNQASTICDYFRRVPPSSA